MSYRVNRETEKKEKSSDNVENNTAIASAGSNNYTITIN